MILEYGIEFIPDKGEAHTSLEFGFILAEYPVIPNAELVYNTYEIPGRDGELVESKSYRKNITIAPTLTLVADEVYQLHYNDYVRKVERWLTGTGWLRISDNVDTLYRVLKVQNGGSERQTPVWGTLTPAFLCEPYEYKTDGLEKYPVSGVTYNAYDLCKPIYRITGNSSGTLTVNGNEIAVNVGQNMTIDTANQITYRTDDGTLIMGNIGGNYEDMWLPNGNVSISISTGLAATVEPRWGWLK